MCLSFWSRLFTFQKYENFHNPEWLSNKVLIKSSLNHSSITTFSLLSHIAQMCLVFRIFLRICFFCSLAYVYLRSFSIVWFLSLSLLFSSVCLFRYSSLSNFRVSCPLYARTTPAIFRLSPVNPQHTTIFTNGISKVFPGLENENIFSLEQ